MPDTTKPKPPSAPAILVYGTPTNPALTQASWFREEDREAVKAAAKELKFSVIELQTDAEKALTAGVHELPATDHGEGPGAHRGELRRVPARDDQGLG